MVLTVHSTKRILCGSIMFLNASTFYLILFFYTSELLFSFSCIDAMMDKTKLLIPKPEDTTKPSLASSNEPVFSDCPPSRVFSEKVCLLDDYLRADSPLSIKTSRGWENVDDITVNCESEIISIREVDDKKQTITFEIFVHLQWRDDRIMVKKDSSPIGAWHTLDSYHVNKIWNPDLTIYNMSSFKRLSIMNPTNGFLKIYVGNAVSSEVIVDYIFNADVTIACAFEFTKYPMDRQRCELRMGSTSYGRYLNFVPWARVPGVSFYQSTEKDDPPEQFDAKGFHMTLTKFTDDFSWCKNLTNKDKIKLCKAEHLKHIVFVVDMTRSFQPFFMHYYAPCIAIVLVTHASFIIPPDCIPGRVALLVTQFLTLVNIFIDQQVLGLCRISLTPFLLSII